MKNIVGSFLISTIAFACYAEYRIGNILYRKQDDGKKHFHIRSLINLITNPLRSTVLWRPDMLDINYFVFVGTGMTLAQLS